MMEYVNKEVRDMEDNFLTDAILKEKGKKKGVLSRAIRSARKIVVNPFGERTFNKRTLTTLEIDFERIFSSSKQAVADSAEE